MERLKLIVNPTSGHEKAIDALNDINVRLRERFVEVDMVLTAAEGDHEEAAARAVEQGYTHLVAVGGDGTLNGVLNGAARHAGALEAVTFGVIPAGTGNDFARTLDLPDDMTDAAERLAAGRTHVVDLGLLNDRLFVNSSAGGLIAETSARVDSGMKTIAGRLAYLFGGAQALLEHEPVRIGIETDRHERRELPMHTFVVSNTPYIGGGFQVAPDASIDDGCLDACVILATTTTNAIAVLRRFAQGERLTDAEAAYFRASRIDVACEKAIWVNTDGEPMQTQAVSYGIRHHAARFLC